MTPARLKAARTVELGALARSYGIQLAYKSASGKRVVASAESLLAVLRALGVSLDSPEQAGEALQARRTDTSRGPLPPVTVAWQGDEHPVVSVRIPGAPTKSGLRAVIELEDGGERSVRLAPAPGGYALPADLPPGYHRLRLDRPGAHDDALLLVAPERAFQAKGDTSAAAGEAAVMAHAGRQWGLFLPLYALSTSRTWAAADYSDLDSAVEWVSDRGGAAFGTLPLLPAFLDTPFDPSPYAPVSRMFWNELYVDPRATAEFKACPEAGALFDLAARTAEGLLKARLVDYQAAWALKRPIFELLARCNRQSDTLATRTDRFLDRNPVVRGYAAFRAACDRRQSSWPDWPDPQRTGGLKAGDYDAAAFQMYAFLQRAAAEQLTIVGRRKAEGGTGLYLDLPIGVSTGGFDPWSNPGLFVLGASAGAPPDIFFSRGQNWGFAPLSPEGMRADRYRHWRAVLRHHMQFSTMLRIDHVMGLHRLFFVPNGMEATDGVYVKFPTEEMYAVLTLESYRAKTIVVGEDLGTVPRYVGPTMRRHGLRQMYATYFQIDPDRRPPVATPTRHMVAFVNTHDMATFEAFWSGRDVDMRLDLGIVDARQAKAEAQAKVRLKRAIVAFLREKGLLGHGASAEGLTEPGPVLRGLLQYLASSPATFLLVNLEDLWLEDSPQNVPGTTDEHPNWRQRARFALEDWDSVPGVAELVEEIVRSRSSGRPDRRD